MDKVKLERIRGRIWSETSSPDFPKGVKVVIGDVIDALLEEEKPVVPEVIMDERTRMKKLILEMLEIV